MVTERRSVVSEWLAIEVKHRKRLPQWLKEAIAQVKAASGLSQLPIVVLHEAGRCHGQALVVMTLGDFVEWFGQPNFNNDEY